MRHLFDVCHRNRQYYDDNGMPKPNCPPRDATDDGDIIWNPKSNDSLSRSVWFDKTVIAYLAQLLIDNNCDGLRV
ncbi:MAG TPA: hypothetical protein VNX68_04450, partial [Nitrosopumilaceae archaeon]|nr:hypothetical protein [Nitrosopumilaceae archaeon]